MKRTGVIEGLALTLHTRHDDIKKVNTNANFFQIFLIRFNKVDFNTAQIHKTLHMVLIHST